MKYIMNTLLPKRKMVQIKRSLDSVFLILAILKRKIIIDLTNGVYLDSVSPHLGSNSDRFHKRDSQVSGHLGIPIKSQT